MKELKVIEKAITKAKQRMKEKLGQKFPLGTIQFFFIQKHQRQPSQGLVLGYNGDGYVRIRLSPKSVKNVYFDKMIN